MEKLWTSFQGKYPQVALLPSRSLLMLFVRTLKSFNECIGVKKSLYDVLVMCRKLIGVWHLLSLKLMELTTLIQRRFQFENALIFMLQCSSRFIIICLNVRLFDYSALYEQLELLVATLIDLDAMDGKSSVSLLAECSSSPDVNTR